MSKKKTILISIIILVVAAAITTLVFVTEPTAARTGATKETAMLVDVTEVSRGDFDPLIIGTGIVRPSQDIMLSPRINGEITSITSSFAPGGYVEKGDILIQIDPADYRNALALRKSDLSQALSDLNIEMGRQDVAKKGYELVEESMPDMNKELIMREPQLNAVKAQVAAARAAVEQARLNLARTTIKAPFDAHILSRNVNIGSQVAPGDNLGRLVGRDVYWVEVSLPLSKLRWLTFPDSQTEKGSPVKVRDRKAWSENAYRQGYLYRLIGALEDQTRMARVLVAVEDPIARESDKPPMILNTFVETEIQGEKLQDVVRLNRDFVRQNNTAWVMKDDRLEIRNLKITFSDARYAYVTSGLEEGDQVVTTNLSTVVEGAKLRTSDSTSVKK